jgi:SPP1 gp7 family putative phage head morphogenesis protein
MAKKLVSPTGKAVVLLPMRTNAGIEAQYRARLEAMVDAMHRSLVYWIAAQYRANSPQMAADAGLESFRDGSPANALRRAVHRMSRRWQKAFDRGAPELAAYFANKSFGASDVQLKQILKKAGFSVEFKMTKGATDAYDLVRWENVSLIKSIASEHLSDVEQLVMRSVQQGRNLGELTEQLQDRYQITRRRAALISRDQANKATATINQVRQKELGITQAIWQHSHAGKHPRPSHVAANGKTYDIDKGMYLDGEWVLPGQAINCRCTSKAVIPGFD